MPPPTDTPYAQQDQYASGTGGDEYIRNVLGGQYLDEGNPHLDEYLANAREALKGQAQQQMAGVNAQSLRPGRLGSSYYQQQAGNIGEQFASASAQAENAARMQVYGQERASQDAAAGLSNQRDQAIWGSEASRYGADAQRAAAQASAGASIAAARAAQQGALERAQLDQVYRQAQLQEGARQFDAGMPLQYGQLLRGMLGDYSQGQQGDTSQLAGLIGQQYGQQAGSIGGYGQMLGQQGQQGLQAAGLYGDMSQSGLPWAQTAAGLAGQGMAAGASRYSTSSQTDLARQQMEYQSMLAQQQSMDPMAALQQFLPFLGTAGGLAGGTTDRYGTQAGTPQPYPSSGAATVQGGLGGLLGGFGMQQGWP